MAPKTEKRSDPGDGVKYSRGQFDEYYGKKQGAKQWEAAGQAAPKAKAKVKAKAKARGKDRADIWSARPADSESKLDHGPGHERRVYANITQLLSDEHNPTPLVLLNKVVGLKHAKLCAKLEWRNPFGSVKDRVGASLILDGIEKGHIGKDTKLVEPTSGNTGLGLIMMANTKGLPLTVPISTRVPQEKRNALRFLGAKLIELDDEL